MGGCLSDEEKVARVTLRDWNRRMLPFIRKHVNGDLIRKYAGEQKGYFGGLNYRSSKVEFRNSAGFFMKAYCSEGDESDFTYGRKIEPFLDGLGLNYSNENFGAEIVTSLKDCFDAEGFSVAFGDQPFGAVGAMPGFGFFARGDGGMFDSYINLVVLAEGFIDLKLKRLDQTMERSHKYIIGKSEKFPKISAFRKVKSLRDLSGVGSFFAFAKDPNLEGYHADDGKDMTRLCREFDGKVVSTKELLRSFR